MELIFAWAEGTRQWERCGRLAEFFLHFYLAPLAPGFRSSRSRSVNISAGAAEWDLWRDRSKMGPPPRDRYLPPISSDATSVPDRWRLLRWSEYSASSGGLKYKQMLLSYPVLFLLQLYRIFFLSNIRVELLFSDYAFHWYGYSYNWQEIAKLYRKLKDLNLNKHQFGVKLYMKITRKPSRNLKNYWKCKTVFFFRCLIEYALRQYDYHLGCQLKIPFND